MIEETGELEIDFDVETITGEEVEDFLKANREFDVESTAFMMARYVTIWPEGWPDGDPETFANQPLAIYTKAIQRFVERMTDLTKN